MASRELATPRAQVADLEESLDWLGGEFQDVLGDLDVALGGESAALEELERVQQRLVRFEADREAHPYGRCTCHGEGSCGWCERQRAIEEVNDGT
jgi:hypothetical protein